MIARLLRFSALALAVALPAGSGALAAPVATAAPLTAQQRSTLDAYLGALQRGNYDAAFALLTHEEQNYFGNAKNFASGFLADGLKILTLNRSESRRSAAASSSASRKTSSSSIRDTSCPSKRKAGSTTACSTKAAAFASKIHRIRGWPWCRKTRP